MLLLMLLCSIRAQAQTEVSGTVSDAGGMTMPGVNVLIKGTLTGTVTDPDGKYTIHVPDENAVLVFSFVGYTAREFVVGNRRQINVTLEEHSTRLGEVVVIGYGTVRKKDATGSVTAVTIDDKNRGKVTGLQDLLTGKSAGVSVTNSGGQPGTAAAIRIRGGSSVSAKNDPLIVIDGVPVDNNGVAGVSNTLSLINPNDIESFTVLKDASATAIYGSRASNGVIIVTTKKGKAGTAPTISYDGNVSMSIRTKEVEVLTSDEYRAFIESTKDAGAIAKMGTANTDWQDEIFKTAWGTDHNLSVTGGLQNMPYRASVGYTNQDGILKTSNFERFSGSVGLSPWFFERHLNININAKGSKINNRFADGGAINGAIAMDPTQPVMVEGGNEYGGYFTWESAPGVPDGNATKNPVSVLEMKDDESDAKSFIGNIQFDYRVHFFPDLKLNLNLGYDMTKSDGNVYIPENAPTDYTVGGRKGTYNQKSKNSLIEFYAQYVKDVQSIRSRFDVMAGYSWQHFYTQGANFYQNIDETRTFEDSDFKREYYLISFYGRFNYTLMERYLLTFTLRRDGTSRYSKDNRWGLFPSLALGWRIKDEVFFKDNDALSELKLRLGWGITGQQDLNDEYYPYIPRYSYGEDNAMAIFGYDADGNPIAVRPLRGDAYNKDLKWEETETYNIGLDYGFFDDRITGAIDYYFRKTNDMINSVPIPAGTNLTDMLLRNVGNLKNSGLEYSVNAIPVTTNDFEWEVGFNFSFNKNEVTKLIDGDDPDYKGVLTGQVDGGTNEKILINRVGYPVNSFLVYQQVYDDAGMPVEGVYVDRNGDGDINEDDRYVYEKGAPDVIMGFSTKLTWRKWDLGINARAFIGNYNYYSVAASNASLNMADVFYLRSYLSNRVKSAFETNFLSKQLLSDYYIQNASFFRIDNITLGYSFEKLIANKLSGRIYFTVQNPAVFTKYDGLDPEITVALDDSNKTGAGIDNRIYPRPTVFLLGVSLNF